MSIFSRSRPGLQIYGSLSKIKKNDIFFAIKGNKIDGNDFVSSAISNGAKIVVTEKKINGLKNGMLFIHSNNSRKLVCDSWLVVFLGGDLRTLVCFIEATQSWQGTY